MQKSHKFGTFPSCEKHRKFSVSEDLVKCEDVLSDSLSLNHVISIDVHEILKTVFGKKVVLHKILMKGRLNSLYFSIIQG